MHRSRLLVAALAGFILTSGATIAAAVDVNVGVNIRVPAPPVVLAAPPLVVVPGSPVQHVPSASFNLFVYQGRYYSFHNGSWFIARGPGGAVDGRGVRCRSDAGACSAREALQDSAWSREEDGGAGRRLVSAGPSQEGALLTRTA
jgi:hypothetical protein